MFACLYSLLCLSFGFSRSLRDVGEPYEDESYYVTAEEYEQLVRAHGEDNDPTHV